MITCLALVNLKICKPDRRPAIILAPDRRPLIIIAPDRRPHQESKMPEKARRKAKATSDAAKLAKKDADDRMEDEEKIMAGRDDVNYPALLTKDVPGG
ncbi:MAG: hypothetical protein QOF90_3371 [Acetobacteraceae bacterium]|nr:hypothetical protein [Acetobacteraceae bacterium]MEA2791226.1 hypothetical protein [Acetobacteraceae bacterium]